MLNLDRFQKIHVDLKVVVVAEEDSGCIALQFLEVSFLEFLEVGS